MSCLGVQQRPPAGPPSKPAAILPIFAAVAAGHMSLVGLDACFPRHVFAFAPDLVWLDLTIVVLLAALAPGSIVGLAQTMCGCLARHPGRVAVVGGLGMLMVAGMSAFVWVKMPAGVFVSVAGAGTSNAARLVRAEPGLNQKDVEALGTWNRPTVLIQSHFAAQVGPPWNQTSARVFEWFVRSDGAFDLWFDRAPLSINRSGPAAGQTTGSSQQVSFSGDASHLTAWFVPGLSPSPRLWIQAFEGVESDPVRLRAHLFLRPIGASWMPWIWLQRLLLDWAVVLGCGGLLLLAVGWTTADPSRVRWMASIPRRWARTSFRVAALASLVTYVAVWAAATPVATSGDGAAYLSYADYLRHFELVQPIPDFVKRWGVAPNPAWLYMGHHADVAQAWGTTPGQHRLFLDDYADPGGLGKVVNIKPAGFPLILAAVRTLFGERAQYSAALASGIAAILALFLLGRSLGLNDGWSASAAAVFALSPLAGFMNLAPQIDPDMPACALSTIMFLALFRAKSGPRWLGLAAGACFGFAVLVRYNMPLLLVPAVPLLWSARRQIFPFALGATPLILVMLGLHWLNYGHPFRFPYLTFGPGSQAVHQPYLVQLGTYAVALYDNLPALIVLPALAYPFLRSRPGVERVVLGSWIVTWMAFFASMPPDPNVIFLRYLLPIYPPLILMSVFVWHNALQRLPWGRVAAGVTLVAVMTAIEVSAIRDNGFLSVTRPASRTIRVAMDALMRNARPADVVIAGELSNAIYYYSDRLHHPINFRAIDARTFADLRRAAEKVGEHPRWFVLVQSDEEDRFTTKHPELALRVIQSGAGWTLSEVLDFGVDNQIEHDHDHQAL